VSNFENLKNGNHVVNLGAVGMINKKGGCKYVGCIQVARFRVEWWAYLNMIVYFVV